MFRPATPPPAHPASTKSYEERAALPNINPTAKKILDIMVSKQSNLCLSADVESIPDLLELIEIAGPEICILKLHWDILPGFNEAVIQQLKALAVTHNFIIFQDSKFSDIGNIAKLQYGRGIFETPIADWSPLVNLHTVAGPGIFDALNSVATSEQFKHLGNGCLVVAEMSSEGTLAKGSYTTESVKMAEKYPNFIMGFISQNRLSASEELLTCTPGVQIVAGKGTLGQQYNTPETAIQRGTDVIIVGSGIYGKKSRDEKTAALKLYKEAGWNAYLDRMNVRKDNVASIRRGMSTSSSTS